MELVTDGLWVWSGWEAGRVGCPGLSQSGDHGSGVSLWPKMAPGQVGSRGEGKGPPQQALSGLLCWVLS